MRRIISTFALLLLVALVSSCSAFAFLLTAVDQTMNSGNSLLPRFDLSDAAAVGVLESNSREIGSRAVVDDLEGFDGFVKLLESGDVVPAMELDNASFSNATVTFIMRGADNSVYIGYDNWGLSFF